MSEPASDSTGASTSAPNRSTFFLVVGGTFGLQFLTMVTGIVTARILGVEGRGIVALVFALGLFASQLTIGGSFPVALTKNLAERRVAARDGVRGLVRRFGWIIVFPCLVAAVVMTLMNHGNSAVVALSVAVFVMALQTIMTRLILGGLQGEVGHLARMVFVALLPQALFAAVLCVVWVAGWDWGPLSVLVAFFVVSAVGHGVGFTALARPTGRLDDRLDHARLWTDTKQTYVSSVRPLDSLGLDRILIGGALGTIALGLYAAAIAVANLCGTIGNAIAVIVLPQIARNHDNPAEQRAIARRWILLTILLVVVVVAGLQLIVEPLIVIAFGSEFATAVVVARWLLIADGLFAIRKVMIAVLQGQGRGATASWIELALTPVLIGGILAAGIWGELIHAGMAVLVVAVLACVALAVAVRRPVRANVSMA